MGLSFSDVHVNGIAPRRRKSAGGRKKRGGEVRRKEGMEVRGRGHMKGTGEEEEGEGTRRW